MTDCLEATSGEQDRVARAAPEFSVGQDVDVAEYVRTCQMCQRTKAAHGGPRGLMPICSPSLRTTVNGWMIWVDWIACLQSVSCR